MQCEKGTKSGASMVLRPKSHLHQKQAFLRKPVQPLSSTLSVTTTKSYYFRLNLKNKACQSAISNRAQSWVLWRDIKGSRLPLPYSVFCWGRWFVVLTWSSSRHLMGISSPCCPQSWAAGTGSSSSSSSSYPGQGKRGSSSMNHNTMTSLSLRTRTSFWNEIKFICLLKKRILLDILKYFKLKE